MKLVFTNTTLEGGSDASPSALASDAADAGGWDDVVTFGEVVNCARTVLQMARSTLDGLASDAVEQPATIDPIRNPAVTL